MKAIETFLSELANLDIRLWVEGDRLRCNAPQGIVTSDIRAELQNRKAEIITFLEQVNPDADSATKPILPVPRNTNLPLSFAQTRLWFLYQLEGGSATYNMTGALNLSGSLNVDALKQATGEILQRHEVLRTSFQQVDGIPVQIIDPNPIWNLPLVDLQQVNEPEAEVQRLATLEAQTPFDVSQSPLLRVTLLRLHPQKHVLLVNMHHIASDGWSISIFMRELSILYAAFCEGKRLSLPKLPIQYADFAIWQRQWLSGDILAAQLSYWKQQLAGAPHLLGLPTDRTRPPVQTFRGSNQEFSVNRQLTQKLKLLSQKAEATLFMTLLTAFTTLLFRLSGQEDILIGSPIANRNRKEIESLIGFFVNTLVLRTHLAGNPSFLELLARVRQVTLEAYTYQDLPFEKLIEALEPKRYLSHSPVFQVMFVLQNAPTQTLEFPGLSISFLPVKQINAKFDMCLSMEETEQGLLGAWEYNSDLFDESTMTRLVGHFQTLLEAIVANPQQPVALLSLLTQQQRQQLLVEWNDTQVNYPQNKFIHQLFEEQVQRTPDAIAVVFTGQKLTYQELNEQANQLAYYLQSLGVTAEVMVGLSVERSLEMIVGLLGILKAGGVYVPIDPAYPKERIAHILSDSHLPVLLTQQKLVAALPKHQGRVVCLDTLREEIFAGGELPVINGVIPENLAYVIYTSGSTGKPKGVAIAHQGLCNLAKAQIKLFGVQSDSCVLQFASLSFDASISEIFMTICAGAKLYLGTPEELQPGTALLGLLQEQKITHVTLVPSALAALPFDELPALENLIVAGEACPANLVDKWSGGRRFFNAYGPTESTVCATVAQCKPGVQVPPIGRPIDNTQIYILDSFLQPVPIGVYGELHIGSVGLARGYLNRPELTQEKFIPNPFDNSKLYKTGDLARYLPDGNIEYLGRIDNQAKLRGFRIELGEIEAVLNQHDDIKTSCAIVREDTPGDRRLVAYVVSHQNSTPTISQLRQFLLNKLPGYMVPNAFVILENLPLTPNGKIDHRALPAPNTQRTEDAKKVLPRDTVELQLAQIWSEILGINEVGIDENFFELGGHSLLAVRLMSRIQQQFGKNLPLTTLFQNGTVEQLATILHQETISQTYLPLIPIQPNGSKPPFFCIHPIGGNVLCYADLARNLGSEQPFYGLQAVGLNENEEPFTCIEDMAAFYIKSIQAIQPTGPYYLGGWSMGGIIAFEMAQQLLVKKDEVALLVLIDSYVPTLISPVSIKEHGSLSSLEKLNDATEVAYSFIKDMAGMLNQEISLSEEEIRYLKPEKLLTYILDLSKKTNVLPPEFGEQQIHLWFRLFHANRRALFSYFPQPYSGQTLLLQADQTSVKDSGWNKVINNLEKQMITGDHYTLLKSKILAQKLSIYLK